jgi:epoxyqueuosine reductase
MCEKSFNIGTNRKALANVFLRYFSDDNNYLPFKKFVKSFSHSESLKKLPFTKYFGYIRMYRNKKESSFFPKDAALELRSINRRYGMSLTSEIKEWIKKRGIDFVGIACAEVLDKKAPDGHRPKDLLPDASGIVVMGMRWPDSIIEGLPDRRDIYSRYMLVMRDEMDAIAFDLSRFFQELEYKAIPIPNSDPYDLTNLIGILSHKHAAVEAGLGELGLSSLLLTPEYGPRIRLVSVITNAPLDFDGPISEKLCQKGQELCKRSCLEKCPVQAISDEGKIDKIKCSYYQDRGLPKMGRNGYTYRCGLCVKNCPLGNRV